MNPLARIKTAARILLKGQPAKRKRGPIPPITDEEAAEARQFFPRRKFFIFGHARSGTTLLMRLARLHSEVHCNYQAHFFTRQPLLKSMVDSPEAEDWLTRKSNRWNQGRDLSPLVLRAAADYIMERDAARAGKMIVGDKSPSSTIHGQAVRDLHAVFPDAWLVYIVRDGRDVLVSERFRNLVEESKFLKAEDRRIIEDLKRDQTPFTDGTRSIFTEAVIRRLARGWVTNLEETEAEGRRLYGERYFSLRYEDLLREPYAQMCRLWEFLGAGGQAPLEAAVKEELASNPDEEWQAKRSESIASFLPKGQAGNWRRLFTARDRAIFKEIAGEMLVHWNYETGTDW